MAKRTVVAIGPLSAFRNNIKSNTYANQKNTFKLNKLMSNRLSEHKLKEEKEKSNKKRVS